jgi:hypothetical protein
VNFNLPVKSLMSFAATADIDFSFWHNINLLMQCVEPVTGYIKVFT